MAEVIVCVGDTTTHGSAIVDHEARKIYKELICHIKPAIDLQVRLVGVQLCNGVLSLFLGSNLSTFSLFAHLKAAVESYPNTPEVSVGNVLHDEALNVIEVLAKVKFFEYAKMSDLTSDAPYVLASKHPVAVYKVATGKFVDNGSGVSPNEYASFNLPDIVDIHAAPPVSFMPKTHGGSNLSALGGSINTTDFKWPPSHVVDFNKKYGYIADDSYYQSYASPKFSALYKSKPSDAISIVTGLQDVVDAILYLKKAKPEPGDMLMISAKKLELVVAAVQERIDNAIQFIAEMTESSQMSQGMDAKLKAEFAEIQKSLDIVLGKSEAKKESHDLSVPTSKPGPDYGSHLADALSKP